MFLFEVADKSFCVKFSGLISKLKILEKVILKSANIQRTDLYNYGALMKPSELFCFKDKKKFAALLFFLGHAIKIPAGKCDRYRVG